VCVARRASTNTPQQALVLLNDPQFVECAGALARLALADASDDFGRCIELYRRLAGRTPEAAEREELAVLLVDARQAFASDPSSAEALRASAACELAPEADLSSWAALWVAASTLLSLDVAIAQR
jgi:hypothetical protein